MTTIKPGHTGGLPTNRADNLPANIGKSDASSTSPAPVALDKLEKVATEHGVRGNAPGGLKEALTPPKAKPLSSPTVFESVPDLPSSLENPGRLKGLIRGTKHENVFGPSKHWAGKHAVRLGNNLTKAIHRALDKLVHDEKKVALDLAEVGPADLDLAIRGKLLRERDLKSDDPRKKAIETALRNDPSSVPVWLELGIDPTLKVGLDPSITLPSGALLKLGITAEAGAKISSQRLLTPTTGDDWKSAIKRDAKRLSGHPFSASALERVEQGGNFTISGTGKLKVEPSIGLGIDAPSAIDAFAPSASISAGLFSTLEGSFEMKVLKTDPQIARLQISSLKSAGSGLSLKAHAGVVPDADKIKNLFQSAATHFQNGGSLETLPSALSTEDSEVLAASFPDYLQEVAGLAASGVSAQVLNDSIESYANLVFEFTKGRKVDKKWGTEFEFQFDSKSVVSINDTRFIPKEAENPQLPLEVPASELAAFAYNAAIRGDLSYAQYYATLPGSGVRLCEELQETKKTSSQKVSISLPFISMKHETSISDTTRTRITSELGKIESRLFAFNEAYVSFFGEQENIDVNVRVHGPDLRSKTTDFIASDDNISADFVVRNDLENATSVEEFQDQVGLLNALSKGALRDDLEEAVTKGREDGSDQHWLGRLIHGDNTFGRTHVNFHVWLGESGLRALLRDDRSSEDLYREIGQAFIDLSAVKEAKAPRWSRRPEILERLANNKDISHFEIADEDLEEIEIAREVIEQIQALQGRLPKDATPAEETALASELRDVAAGFSDRLKAFAALSVLVPEKSRAVEMHLMALRPDTAPIRFAYLQDSRSADILQATAYASTALAQLNTYGFAASHDTRVRLGAVLADLHGILNAPSPDPYQLRVTEHALNKELSRFDKEVTKALPDLVKDTRAAEVWLHQLPEDSLIAEALPTDEGRALVALKQRVRSELEKTPPSYPHLKDAIIKLSQRSPEIRALENAAPVLRGLASTLNNLGDDERSKIAEEAELLVENWHSSFGKDFDPTTTAEALEAITGLVGDTIRKGTPPLTLGTDELETPDEIPDLEADREASADRMKDKNVGFSQSYFLRDGTIAAHFFSPNTTVKDAQKIGSSQIDMATLEMLSAQRRANIEPPALSNDEAWDLLGHIAKGQASEFLAESSRLAYRERPPLTEERVMLSQWAKTLTPAIREKLPQKLQSQLKALFSEPDERSLKTPRSQRSSSDQTYLEKLAKEEPEKISEALSILGYTNTLKHWKKPPRYRLDDVLVGVSGDKLRSFLNGMDKAQKTSFLAQIKSSDLSPFTRARLAGEIVSRDIFWKLDEETVTALVTGMNSADYPVFFDALYAEGKLEAFLAPGSFWQRLLNVLTFGIARLFTHDNQAALRVLKSHGYSTSSLGGHYDTTASLSARYETLVGKTLASAASTPLPIDDWMKSGIVAAHSIVWESNLEDFKTLPKRAEKLLEKVAEVTAEKVASRVLDISSRGGDFDAVKADLDEYFQALSPEAIKTAFAEGDNDAESVLIAKAIREKVIKELERQDKDPKSPYITSELVAFVSEVTDDPAFHKDEEETQ